MRVRAGRVARRASMVRVQRRRRVEEARRARTREGRPAAGMRRSVGRAPGGGGPAEMPVLPVGCLRLTASAYRRASATTRMDYYLTKQSRSLRRRERCPSYTHTAAPVLGLRAATPGVAANPGPSVDVSSTASCAAPTGRVPGLRGAFIIASTPCSCVGCGVPHSGIVRLSKSSRQMC